MTERSPLVLDSNGGLQELPPGDSVPGIVQLATPDEAVAGTDTTKAVTPAGVAAALPLAIHFESTEAAAEAASETDPGGWYAAPVGS
ncbi:MAG: hypothetical protein LBF61_00830 [Azoarcus sp.]|jgi:hypothetical protein|nr:hypothetical protein [Azoarcus sp.]